MKAFSDMNPKMSTKRAPKHLLPETRRWFRWVLSEWDLGQHHERILVAACQAWDRMTAARLVIDAEGLTYLDRFGVPRPRPEIAIERDSRLGFLRCLRELDLDIEPPSEPARPRAIRSNRG